MVVMISNIRKGLSIELVRVDWETLSNRFTGSILNLFLCHLSLEG